MPLHYYNIDDDSNISNQIIELESKINNDPEIIPSILNILYNNTNKTIEITFSMALTKNEILILNKIVDIIIFNKTTKDIQPLPYDIIQRQTLIGKFAPSNIHDERSNYNIGSIVYDTPNNVAYLCYDNTTNNAIWKPISTGITGWTGATGAIGQNVYNSSGAINGVKVWIGNASTSTSSGIATFDISSANFNNIISSVATCVRSAIASLQTWCVITNITNTSCSVTVYRMLATSTTILGISAIGTAQQEIYLGQSVPINLIIYGI